jgi:hypothetical protein
VPVPHFRKAKSVQSTASDGSSAAAAAAGRALRFFVSYRRRADDDVRLAKLLVEELRKAGHEVFIDVDIRVGTDWPAEITRHIQWCDYLVVLLSEDSIDSEMVQGEVRLARQYRRDDSSPHMFPVRVRYEGALDYELTSYLGRLQFILWRGSGDDATVVGAVLSAARAGEGARETTTATAPEQAEITDARRPRPSVDRTALLRPTRTLVPLRRPGFPCRQNAAVKRQLSP